MYRLLFMNGNLKGKRLTIQQGDLLIGSGEECHVRIQDDEKVAGHHAVIEYKHGHATLRDLGALNKVEVNDHPVVEQRLRHGDRIAVGDTRMEFHAPGAKAPPHQRRRFSKMQATSIAAISGIVLLQIGFVIFFPLWQRNETVAVVVPPPRVEQPPPAPVKAVEESRADKPAPAEVVQEKPEEAVSAEVQPAPAATEPAPETIAEAPPAAVSPEAVAPPPPGFAQEQEARAEIAEARASMERVAEDVSGRLESAVAEERIRILDVERERFQASSEYDEMRRLRIRLRPLPELGTIDGGEVRVSVRFFDRVEGSGEVVASLMRVQSGGLKIDGEWPPGEARTVSAAYVVPRGYRQRETTLLGERRSYEGFVVNVFYREKLQDRFALPKDLLDRGE
jgi:hypothetical protein